MTAVAPALMPDKSLLDDVVLCPREPVDEQFRAYCEKYWSDGLTDANICYAKEEYELLFSAAPTEPNAAMRRLLEAAEWEAGFHNNEGELPCDCQFCAALEAFKQSIAAMKEK